MGDRQCASSTDCQFTTAVTQRDGQPHLHIHAIGQFRPNLFNLGVFTWLEPTKKQDERSMLEGPSGAQLTRNQGHFGVS